jgi:serine/threonine protein phosphatase PrpC
VAEGCLSMRIRPDVELANLTDVGIQREKNEDYFIYLEPEDDGEFARKGRLLLVADGMGGHAGGELASGIAAAALRDAFLHSDAEDPQTVLVEGFSRAQREIVARSRETGELRGMGTTCTAVILRDGELSFGHIGDSRLYLLRDGVLTQLTEDHTLVQQLVKDGSLSRDEAEAFEQKNVLTAALGMRPDTAAADFSRAPIALEAGDTLMISSDGLHSLVDDREIAKMAGRMRPYEACRALRNLAIKRGGPDNITVQILRVLTVAQ